MTISLRANNDGSAIILVQGQPRITLDAAGNIIGTNTAPVSDSSKKLATTEFVANRSQMYKSIVPITGNYTISAGDAGNYLLVSLSTGSTITVTIPPSSSVPVGFVVKVGLRSPSAARCTLTPSGTDVLWGAETLQWTNSFPATLGPGEYAELINGPSGWQMVEGPLLLNAGGTVFAGINNMLGGYRRLPGGVILQWGQFQANATTVPATINLVFPIPFPNNLFSFQGIYGTSDPSQRFMGYATATAITTNMTVTYITPTNNQVRWFATGY